MRTKLARMVVGIAVTLLLASCATGLYKPATGGWGLTFELQTLRYKIINLDAMTGGRVRLDVTVYNFTDSPQPVERGVVSLRGTSGKILAAVSGVLSGRELPATLQPHTTKELSFFFSDITDAERA